MKITKPRLKRIIQEELSEMFGQASMPGGDTIKKISGFIMSAIDSAMNLPEGEDGDQVVRKLREASLVLYRMREKHRK
jgi:hypothetical protein